MNEIERFRADIDTARREARHLRSVNDALRIDKGELERKCQRLRALLVKAYRESTGACVVCGTLTNRSWWLGETGEWGDHDPRRLCNTCQAHIDVSGVAFDVVRHVLAGDFVRAKDRFDVLRRAVGGGG